LSETEQRLQVLAKAIVTGNAEEARYSTNAALARGCTPFDVLDTLVDAVSTVVDLHEVGEFDAARITNAEAAVDSCLRILEEKLVSSEKRFGLKASVGPVGLKAGGILATAISAALRSVGVRTATLPNTQTPRDLFRNSEELGVDAAIPLLSGDQINDQLDALIREWEAGGFKNKFDLIVLAPGHSSTYERAMTARNSGEVVTMVAEWALKKQNAARGK